jgi:hypothetical protein
MQEAASTQRASFLHNQPFFVHSSQDAAPVRKDQHLADHGFHHRSPQFKMKNWLGACHTDHLAVVWAEKLTYA